MDRKKPKLINLHDYEENMQKNLSRPVRDYYHAGANDMITLRENRAAFLRYAIIPRVLRDVSKVSTKVTLLGKEISSPICIAPSAMQRMAHPDGEIATARAASRFGTVMTLSSLSTTSLEDVIKAGSTMSPAKGIYWFQLYAYKNEDITRDLIRRAETSGYQAIVLTVDTPMLGRREPDLRNHFSLPSHLTIANFQKYFENSQKNSEASTMTMNTRPTIATKDSANNNSAVANYFSLLINDSLTWEHTILWIKSNTKLKIVLKGIITPEEALTATQYPVDAIWISNHGARQLDTAPATIETVAAIKAVVQNKCEIYVDGGITRGTDIFMALALGANAVFLGRPILWGLAYDGEEGLVDILEMLKVELIETMKLAGCTKIEDINEQYIRQKLMLLSKL